MNEGETLPHRPWRPDGQPFIWLPRDALRKIEENCPQPATAMLVFLALCRIANDERSASFEKPLGYVARLACVNRRTVDRRLKDLTSIGLVTITAQAIPGTAAHGFDRFTLATPSPKVATPSHNLGTEIHSVRVADTKEGESKNSKRPTAYTLKIQLEAIDGEIQQIKNRGFEDAWGTQIQEKDKARYRALCAKRKQIRIEMTRLT